MLYLGARRDILFKGILGLLTTCHAAIVNNCDRVYLFIDFVSLQIMSSVSITLPTKEDRSRLLGKENKKIKDIELVSGACLIIGKGNTVQIRAHTNEALKLAEGMVMKSLKHRKAANIGGVQPEEVESPLIWDLRLAAYYTYSDIQIGHVTYSDI